MKNLFKYCVLCCLLMRELLFAVEITDIQVRSQIPGREVELSAVKAFVQPRVGDTYNPTQVNQDIRSLQETGRYAYVGAELETVPGGVILVYVVEERPRLRSITVEGAQHFSNAKVRDLMALNLSDRVDIPLVMTKLESVREKYVKDFYTRVTFDVKLSPPDEEGFTQLTVVVDEGEQRKVREIRFPGRIFYTRTQLKKMMGQKETWILSGITGRGKLDESQLRQDLSTLEEMYRRQGYLDAKAGPYTIEDLGNGLKINIPITPYDHTSSIAFGSRAILCIPHRCSGRKYPSK